MKRVVLFALKSPRFLYPEMPQRQAPDDYEVAARLALQSLGFHPRPEARCRPRPRGSSTRMSRSPPQAARMIADPRTKAKLHGFFHHWLELERAEAITKDPKAFPELRRRRARRLAHFAPALSRPGRLERALRLPRAAPGELPAPQRAPRRSSMARRSTARASSAWSSIRSSAPASSRIRICSRLLPPASRPRRSIAASSSPAPSSA